jgi:hypothetical protein
MRMIAEANHGLEVDVAVLVLDVDVVERIFLSRLMMPVRHTVVELGRGSRGGGT